MFVQGITGIFISCQKILLIVLMLSLFYKIKIYIQDADIFYTPVFNLN